MLSDEGIEKLDAIEASTTRMEQLIRSLLGFAQVNANSPVMDTIEVDDILTFVLADLGKTIRETKTKIQLWTF